MPLKNDKRHNVLFFNKKPWRFLILFLSLVSISKFADAQYFKPAWVNDIGGTGDSKATNIVADHNGNIYISGYIRGTVTFNLREGGSKTLTATGNANVYIAKYNIVTGSYLWAISLSGDGLDQPNSMTLDNSGNVLVTGQFSSTTNFNPKGSFNLTSNGADDIFVAKYTANGDFVWAIGMGRAAIDRGHYITTDSQNNVFISGSYTTAVDVDPSPAQYLLPDKNSLAFFFAKYDSNGNFLWAHALGAINEQNLINITIDKATNDVVLDGDFSGNVDFSYTGQSAATFNSPGISNFVARYTNNGTYKWVRYLPGSGSCILSSLKINSQSDIIITGNFNGQFFPNGPSANSISSKGINDLLIASYKADGTLNWAENFGGSNGDVNSRYVTVDGNDNLYVAGYFTGTVIIDPALSNGTLSNAAGGRSILIAGFTSSGKALAAGAIGNGCTSNYGYEVAADNANIYVAGSFCQTVDFDTGTCNTDNVTAINGSSDSFVASFSIVNPLSDAQITAFTVPQQIAPAVIDQNNHTIALTVASGSDITALVPSLTVSNSATVSPASGLVQNFTSPVVYTTSSGCGGASYTVTVTLAVAKNITTCAGSPNSATGDATSPIPDSYTWQLLQNNVWVNAPGVNNIKDYQTSALTNTTNSNVVYQLRRQISVSGIISYDSFYNITVQPAIAITNNQITQPSVIAFCVNGDPGTITGNTPSGGTGTFTFQWQSSTDNVTFSNIPGATLSDFDPPALTVTTYYQRIATSGTCDAPVVSNAITINILPATSNNNITAPAVTSFCISGSPSVITGSLPSGGNGTYVYQWQSSADNTTFTDVAGATSKDFTPASVNANTYYRRTVTSGACITPLISNTVTITILAAVANNTITVPAVTSFCTNGDPGNIAGAVPSGGNGTYAYQWQNSTDNVNFSDISGATAKDYDPPVIAATTWYRRVVTPAICTTPLLSNVVAINIASKPATPVPVNPIVQVCTGNTASLSVSSPQQGITYDWYDSAAKTNHLFTGITFVTGVLNASQTFYVEATNGACSSLNLASVQVNMLSLPALPQLVSNPVLVCNGSVATFNILNPQTGFTYNWYTTQTGGSPIFTGTGFATPALTTNTSYYAEAVNGNGCVSLSRTVANVTINALPVVTVQGAAVCPGTAATLLAASTDPNAAINWYAGATGGSIIFTGNSFLIPVLNGSVTYYTEATDNTTGCVSAARTPVQAQILQQLAAPVVTAGPTTSTSIIFQWTAVPGATGYRVSIDNGQTFSDPSSGNAGLTTTLTGLLPLQSVTILVQATGTQPCQLSGSSTAVTAKAIDLHNNLIYVANAFTPNGDGKNDVVYVHSESIKSLKFYVYNQWGELLYTSLSQQSGWDGTYKGVREPAGVYVYYLEATMNDGQPITKKGTITLLR